MRSILLLILLFSSTLSLSAQATTQPQNPNLKIMGAVTKIEAVEVEPNTDDAYYNTTIRVAARMTNSGSRTIILMQKEPDLKRAILSKTGYKSPSEGSDDLAEYLGEYYYSSYFMDATKWSAIKRNFDKSLPPPDLTRRLLPGESIEFETEFAFRLPVVFRYENTRFLNPQSLGLIKQMSPVELTLEYRTWSTVSLGKQYLRTSQNFVEKLRKRWRNEGDLITSDITLRSIPIDFNSVLLPSRTN